MSDAGYSMLGAGAWGWPREMLWGGRWEGGSCLGTHVRIKDFKIQKKKDRLIFLGSCHQLKAGLRKDLEPRSPFQQASGCCLLFSYSPREALSFSNFPSWGLLPDLYRWHGVNITHTHNMFMQGHTHTKCLCKGNLKCPGLVSETHFCGLLA